MSTLLSTGPADSRAEAAGRLRETTAACRVSFTWLGTQKALTPEQRTAAAEPFDADGRLLRAGKTLLDTKHPAYRAVTAVRTRITDLWRGRTLPYPEPGVRLIPREKVEPFAADMADLRDELADAVRNLDEHYADLKRAAAERLGSLYDGRDYPPALAGLFDVSWDFPAVEPPDYLLRLSPALFEAEQARVRARFDEAVRLAEQAFLEEFARLVDHLCGRLSGGAEDGGPKVFRDSAVGNLAEFFDRFRSLNVHSSEQLDELVDRARRAMRGVSAQELRDSAALRRHVAEQLSQVQATLDGLTTDRPRRRVLRASAGPGAA